MQSNLCPECLLCCEATQMINQCCGFPFIDDLSQPMLTQPDQIPLCALWMNNAPVICICGHRAHYRNSGTFNFQFFKARLISFNYSQGRLTEALAGFYRSIVPCTLYFNHKFGPAGTSPALSGLIRGQILALKPFGAGDTNN